MKKILLVSNTAWSLFNFRISLMRYLKSQGAEIYAVAPYDEIAEQLKKEFPFVTLEMLDRKGKFFGKDFKFFMELYHIYNKYNLVLYLSSSAISLEKTVTALYQKEY